MAAPRFVLLPDADPVRINRNSRTESQVLVFLHDVCWYNIRFLQKVIFEHLMLYYIIINYYNYAIVLKYDAVSAKKDCP